MYLNIIIFLYALFMSQVVECRGAPSTIREISIEKYLGHWYQVYAAPTNAVFQGYGTCITADYGLYSSNNISVLNSQINKEHELEKISGYGYYKNISEPGQLTVHLDGVPVDSPYWIVKLGEVVNNMYQYSIITTPSGISLWVLTRDVVLFYRKYDDEVKKFLDEYGFKYNQVVQINCYVSRI